MNTNNSEFIEIEIRPYTLSDLARLYKVDRKTFRNWLKPFMEEIGERIGNYFSVTQVRIIFQSIEPPFIIKISNDLDEGREERKKVSKKDKVYGKTYSVGKFGKGIDNSFPSHDF